ncbi:MAG TPA: LamG-like jellyroll fold domain-containing protein [Saprospiraceae bacterium]|nr:LamG-like jellyroll fold domain-containing protein [Saprospiraceae bacterium]
MAYPYIWTFQKQRFGVKTGLFIRDAAGLKYDKPIRMSLRHMKYWFCLLVVIILRLPGFAQPVDGLIAYYSFNACDAHDDHTGGGADGIIVGSTMCGCGVSGNGLRFDGNTSVQILGNPDVLFGDDFTISFFIQPDPQGNSIMDILSKSETCGIDSTVEMRYNPVTRELSLTLSQQANNIVRSVYRLPADRCYHHIVFVRRDREVLFYYDGVEQSKAPSVAFVKILNNGILTLGSGPCLANGDVPFRGNLDELRLYDRALTSFEVQELGLPIDQITSPDTVLFTGTSMQIRLPKTCATTIQWNPAIGVNPPNQAQPIIIPPATTTYYVTMSYGFCQAVDSIHITVADSSDLDCDKIFFPTGFTPNGDRINDDWGMSNVVFLGEFKTLQVFDRWGGEVFSTTDVNEKWDGTKDGKELEPGQYIYFFSYLCEGQERKKTGSVVLIR